MRARMLRNPWKSNFRGDEFLDVFPATNKITKEFDPYILYGGGKMVHISTIMSMGKHAKLVIEGVGEVTPEQFLEHARVECAGK